HIVKLPVHGREPHVRDGIELAKPLHHALAEFLRRYVAAKFGFEFTQHAVGQRLDLLGADRTFLAGFLDTGDELRAVGLLVLAVAFLNAEMFAVDFLVRRKARAASQTLSAAANLHPIAAAAGIDYLVILRTALRT